VTQWNAPDEVTEYLAVLDKLTKRRYKKRKSEPSSQIKAAKIKITSEAKGDAEMSTSIAVTSVAVEQPDREAVDDFADFDEYDNFNAYKAGSPETTPQQQQAISQVEGTPVQVAVESYAYDWETSPTVQQEESAVVNQILLVNTAEVEEDTTQALLKAIELQLSLPDAIMEPGVHATLLSLAQESGEDSEKMLHKNMNSLIQGYRGYAQMACIASGWLHKCLELCPPKTCQHILSDDMETNIMNFIAKYITGDILYNILFI
jgi:hypothetical protein